MKLFTDSSTHLGKLFVPVTIWRHTRRVRKCLFSKPFTLLVVLALLWRDNIVESFLLVLHHQETLSIGLLNSLNKQELCVCENVGREVNNFVLLHKVSDHRGHHMENFLVQQTNSPGA
jgi:hypothetical protein